jgi:Skp family chaperone for outer membrane proteins
MHQRAFWKVVVVLTLVVAATFITASAQQQRGRPTSIAVVDIGKALESLEETAQIEADLKAQFEALKQDHQGKQDQLKQDLEILQPGTDAFKQKSNEFQLKAIELESWWKFQQANVARERVLLIEGLYRKLTDAIGKSATENGYDLVLYKEQDPDFRNAKPETLMASLAVRKVLWSKSDLDLTDQVILRMNNEWKNNRR